MSKEATISTLLVTANVGSIFEEPEQMLEVWTEEFLSTIKKIEPKFIALHCQEVGGKNYEKSMQHVENFVRLLLTSEELQSFDRVRIYLDEDYTAAEHFTALGNLYFIHESLKEVLYFDFTELKYSEVIGKEVHSGNIEAITTKEKAKFPQDFFPECKWSRKGFLRTRWSVEGTVFDLVNIHLFHDASNFVAMEEFPSVYSKNRRRALEYTLNRFHTDQYGTVPYFIFGDFNFRIDTGSVVKKLTEGLSTSRIQNPEKNDHTKLQYHDDNSQLILTVGKKEFTHSEHQNVFLSNETWLRLLDHEFKTFESQLFEYPINFPPSYPFSESLKLATSYMHTRCPSWCDRVLLSNTAKLLVSESDNSSAPVQYNMIGIDKCMGDHKPIYLKLELLKDSGTIHCCSHNPALVCSLTPTKCVCCNAYASVTIHVTDFSDELFNVNNPNPLHHHTSRNPRFVDRILIDKNLLHEPYTKEMLTHDPYTPESAESHSPIPDDLQDNHHKPSDPSKKSVSPYLLKSRLEEVLRSLEKGFYEIDTRDRGRQSIKRCQSEFTAINEYALFPRNRCMSETRSSGVKTRGRVRLYSTTSVQSISRLEGHHSSSDEEWFEEVNDEETNRTKDDSQNDEHSRMLNRNSSKIDFSYDDSVEIEDAKKIHKKICCKIL